MGRDTLLDQVAQNSIQRGFEHFWEWETHNSGQKMWTIIFSPI